MDLVLKSLSISTRKAYGRALTQFCKFVQGKNTYPIPCPQALLVEYILDLFNRGYSHSSITSNLSAINFVHRLANLSPPSEAFLVKKLMIGISKQNGKGDVRLSITPEILSKMINMVHIPFAGNIYLATMLKAMYSLAFHAFLRVGEMTSSPTANNAIQIDNISKDKKSFRIVMSNYKHAPLNQQTTIEVLKSETSICPFSRLSAYLILRPKLSGPLFIFQDGKGISKNFFTSCLVKSLAILGLEKSKYKSHSFRIGAATFAASQGLSDDQIMRMGRWKSNAFMKYIRLPTIHHTNHKGMTVATGT